MREKVRVVLYTKPVCGLCDEMKAVMKSAGCDELFDERRRGNHRILTTTSFRNDDSVQVRALFARRERVAQRARLRFSLLEGVALVCMRARWSLLNSRGLRR